MKAPLLTSTSLLSLIGTYNFRYFGQGVVVNADGKVRPMTPAEDAMHARALERSFLETKEIACQSRSTSIRK